MLNKEATKNLSLHLAFSDFLTALKVNLTLLLESF